MSNNPSFSSGIPKEANRILVSASTFTKASQPFPYGKCLHFHSWVRYETTPLNRKAVCEARNSLQTDSYVEMTCGQNIGACWLVSKLVTNPLYIERALFQRKSLLAGLGTNEHNSLIQSPMHSLMSSNSHPGLRKRDLVTRLGYRGLHPVTSLVTHILNYHDACAWMLPFRVLWILWVCQESVMSNIWSSRSKYGRNSYVYEKATWKKKMKWEKVSKEIHVRVYHPDACGTITVCLANMAAAWTASTRCMQAAFYYPHPPPQKNSASLLTINIYDNPSP